jgi:hypothetical protein
MAGYRRDEKGFGCRRYSRSRYRTGVADCSFAPRAREELAGVAIPVARVAGIALIALGIACWPGPPLVGMLIYSAIVGLYFAYLGFAVGFAGVFLWPAVALHAVLSILLGRAWFGAEAR